MTVTHSRMKVDQVLSTVEITPLIVKNKLLKLNKSKSTGPDLIHPWVLSETAGSICIPLAMIFTKSMEQGTIGNSIDYIPLQLLSLH